MPQRRAFGTRVLTHDERPVADYERGGSQPADRRNRESPFDLPAPEAIRSLRRADRPRDAPSASPATRGFPDAGFRYPVFRA